MCNKLKSLEQISQEIETEVYFKIVCDFIIIRIIIALPP